MAGNNYFSRLLAKMGKKTGGPSVAWAVHAWNTCLEQLGAQRDIVFFGDSLTELNNWQERYPEQSIANIGFYGDTLPGLLDRVSMVKSLGPKKVFFLGGINSLRENTVDLCLEIYEKLLDELLAAAPNAKFYIQSVLPVSKEKESTVCKNRTIQSFNAKIKAMALERNMEWVDLNSHFILDGVMDPSLTTDGCHLTPKAYVLWSGLIEDKVRD